MIDDILEYIYGQEKRLQIEQITYMKHSNADVTTDDTIAYIDGRLDALRLVSDQILELSCARTV